MTAHTSPERTDAHRTAALVSIGDELTLGQTLNTNSKSLASQLLDRGVRTVEHVTLDDDEHAIADAIARLALSVDLILITGGLGPTGDDLTRAALARALGDGLIEDRASLAEVEAWFARSDRTMPPTNRVQALRPSTAEPISNDHGTAPGLRATLEKADIFCLPGPPREMQPMFDDVVLPRLRPDSSRTVRTRVLKTFGLGESEIARRLGDAMSRTRGTLIGTTASMGIVSIRMRYEGPAADASAALDEAEAIARDAAGPCVIGATDHPVGHLAAASLAARGETISLAESCTGGLVSKMLTDTPGSSAVVMAGLVTYTNEMKQALLGVPAELFNDDTHTDRPGAESEEVATAMAEGCRDRMGTCHAVAITGIAGPTGAVTGKPVGTVYIAHATQVGTQCRRFLFRGDRQAIRTWSANTALGMLLLNRRVGLQQRFVGEVAGAK